MKAVDTLNIVLVQLELFMAVGNSLELKTMLEKFSSVAIKSLNVPAIHIILKKNEILKSVNQIISYPIISESEYDVIDSSFMSIPEKTAFEDCITSHGSHSYIYSIENIGYITFERHEKELHPHLVQALIPVVERLGKACFNCYQHNQMIRSNLKKELSESKLHLETSKLQTTLNAISNGVITLNREFDILFLNPKAQHFLEATAQEYKDKNIKTFFKLLDTDDGKDVTNIFFEYLDIKGKWVDIMPLTLETSSGKHLSIVLNAKGIVNNSGDISSYVVVIQDVTHTLKIENELKWQATHDSLTHLLNRRGFESYLQKLIYRDNKSTHVLLYMDLDRFKIVNDVCGHQAGDSLLQQVSEIINNDIRGTDVLSRLGGDEFGVILHDCNVEYALELAERIKQSIAKFRFSWDNNLFNIGVSIGVSTINNLTTDIEKIMIHADMACYSAKENGRNQVYIADYDHEASTSKKTNTNFVSLVNSAIEEDRLVLYGQQIVPTTDDNGEKSHIEILLRMLDKGKIVPPDAFLPIAERYGKIRDIDLWVINKAFEYLLDDTDFQVNINLSGVTLSDSNALAKIIEIIKNNVSKAKRICFEITETAAISNLDRCVSFIKELQTLGCSFALDDFGSGLSSFSYLKHLPVKYLKIDGSFIKDICNNKTDEIVVESIHRTAKALSIKTVAEYVSNEEIYESVKRIGVDLIQGYYIGKPQELSTLIEMTKENCKAQDDEAIAIA